MRAIILKDEDFKNLLQTLELEQYKGSHGRTETTKDISEAAWNAMRSDIHRWFHYHVVNWSQKHGATLH
jgi:hypothetical protein